MEVFPVVPNPVDDPPFVFEGLLIIEYVRPASTRCVPFELAVYPFLVVRIPRVHPQPAEINAKLSQDGLLGIGVEIPLELGHGFAAGPQQVDRKPVGDLLSKRHVKSFTGIHMWLLVSRGKRHSLPAPYQSPGLLRAGSAPPQRRIGKEG